MKPFLLLFALVLLVACGQKPKTETADSNKTDQNATDQNSADQNSADRNAPEQNSTNQNSTPAPALVKEGNATDVNGSDGNGADGNGTDSNETAVATYEEKAEPKSDSDLLLIIVLLLVVVSNFFLWRLYSDFERWKERSADGKHFIVIPDKVQDYVEQSEGAMRTLGDKLVEFREALAMTATRMVGRVDEQKKALDKSIEEFEQHLEAVKGLADERKQEIDRYKQGYDIVAKKALLLEMIDAIDTADGYLEKLRAAESADPDALEGIETVREMLMITLENDNIDRFLPEVGVGVDSETVRGKIKILSTIEAEDPAQVGTIASVKAPCYFTNVTEEETVTIRPALVVAYKEPPRHEEEEGGETESSEREES